MRTDRQVPLRFVALWLLVVAVCGGASWWVIDRVGRETGATAWRVPTSTPGPVAAGPATVESGGSVATSAPSTPLTPLTPSVSATPSVPPPGAQTPVPPRGSPAPPPAGQRPAQPPHPPGSATPRGSAAPHPRPAPAGTGASRPDPVTVSVRSFASSGGTVTAACRAGAIELRSAVPADGFQVSQHTEDGKLEVKFEGSGDEYEVQVSCHNGIPVRSD